MELIADGVLILAAFAATAYCMVLSRRLRRLSEMDGGLGAAITSLSREVDHLSSALAEAKTATTDSATDLSAQCRAANAAARRLEALVNRANKTPLQRAARPNQAAPAAQSTKPEPQISDCRTSDQDTPRQTPPEAMAPVAPKQDAATDEMASTSSSKTAQPTVKSAEKDEAPRSAAIDDDGFDARALDKFIGAIVANGAEGDNAVLARRLVMALATTEERKSS